MRGELDIGGRCKIPVWTYGKTQEQRLASLKKFSTVSADPDGRSIYC